ncbi:hypothetical protein D3C81_1014090 [compost metagenome]
MLIGVEVKQSLETVTIVVQHLLLLAEIADERQPYQIELQPFGFMDGDHLYQMAVAFQP